MEKVIIKKNTFIFIIFILLKLLYRYIMHSHGRYLI